MILAALLLVIASTAGAASLGRLAVLSAIGEPLRAEIEVSVAAEDLDSATPRFASPDTYAAAGLQYNAALNGARLAIQYRQNGRRVIAVLTARPVNEPSIPLLVEMDVRGGRISRGYNVLLGVPVDAVATAAAPVAVTPAPVAVAAAPVPVAGKPAAAVRAESVPRAARTSAPSGGAAAPADRSRYDREIKRLESQLAAGDKVLADLLDRVALMEREVRQMQHALTLQGRIPSPKPDVVAPPAGVIEKSAPLPVAAAPVAAVDSQPRSRSGKQDYVNEALLVLAGGVLILLGWLAYWVWGRRQSARNTEDTTGLAPAS